MMLAIPAFATPDIASNSNGNGSCVEPVLHRYDGTANLQAGWQANTIQLKWYNDDTQLDVQDAADSCTYDGALTLPETQPTKTGYTFAGWRVKICRVPASLVNSGGSNVGYALLEEPPYGGGTGYNEAQYGLTQYSGEWAVEWSTGEIVHGMSKCSDTAGTGMWVLGNPSDTDGGYCWCAATKYTTSVGNQCSIATPLWVYVGNPGSYCGATCAYDCARYAAQSNSAFRAAAFLGGGNGD